MIRVLKFSERVVVRRTFYPCIVNADFFACPQIVIYDHASRADDSHYGDSYIPYLHQEEPLKLACQHFIECIKTNSEPLTNGRQGLELVRILEAASASLKMNGAPVTFASSTRPAPAFAPAKTEEVLEVEAFAG